MERNATTFKAESSASVLIIIIGLRTNGILSLLIYPKRRLLLSIVVQPYVPCVIIAYSLRLTICPTYLVTNRTCSCWAFILLLASPFFVLLYRLKHVVVGLVCFFLSHVSSNIILHSVFPSTMFYRCEGKATVSVISHAFSRCSNSMADWSLEHRGRNPSLGELSIVVFTRNSASCVPCVSCSGVEPPTPHPPV